MNASNYYFLVLQYLDGLLYELKNKCRCSASDVAYTGDLALPPFSLKTPRRVTTASKRVS